MLVYHPAYDAYHCIFRSLLITDAVRIIEVEKLRILDFFFCFPAELRRVRLPKGHGDAKRIAANAQNDYHGPVSMLQAFRDMEHIQVAAFQTLAATQIIDTGEFESGLIRRTEISLPESLQTSIDKAAEENQALIKYIADRLGDLPLLGENGLKHRTGLMEYRYDVA